MSLIDNINFLTERFPRFWEVFKDMAEEIKAQPALVETAKSGEPTLKIQKDGREYYIHSKYDPIREAEKFVAQFQDVDKYNHVFFYGAGLGYHIEAFLRKYPNLEYTIYEPEPAFFGAFLSTKSFINPKKLKNLYVQFARKAMPVYLKDFIDFTEGEALFITLPSYERVLAEEYREFHDCFIRLISDKRQSLRTNFAYQKRWIINSLVNFEELLRSPNILLQKKKYFQGRPVLLVAAGPSLSMEYENIRYIKKHGLAYIFSVGSAVNALVNNGIMPDAACAFDPSHLSIKVFEKILAEKKDGFPLVFGSSISHEIPRQFHGPKLHMIVSQDTIAPFFFKTKNNQPLEIVHDAPTIAIVTLELLYKLGANLVILVGQNLGYLNDNNNRRYAEGIEYSHVSSEIEPEKRKELKLTENVYGEMISTNEGFIRYREQMEGWIKKLSSLEVVNTTKGGAKIDGAAFVTLEDVIAERLTQPVVEPEWYLKEDNMYDYDYLLSQQQKLDKAYDEVNKVISNIKEQLKMINKLLKQNNLQQVERTISLFNQELKNLVQNEFYQLFLKPMERVGLEFLARRLDEIKFETNVKVKAEKILADFGKLINQLEKDLEFLEPHLTRLQDLANSLKEDGGTNAAAK